MIRAHKRYDGQVLELVLGPPPANILTLDIMTELAAKLSTLTGHPQSPLKLVIIRGDGEHFSYGASVEEHRPGKIREMLPFFHSLLRQVIECPTPTLAQVSGLCLGGGFELALACSLIACDGKAELGVPEITLGVFPPAASVLLSSKTSHSLASEMVLTGRRYSAGELHRYGVVTMLAEPGKLDGFVSGFVEANILPKSASSLRLAWQASRQATLHHYNSHIDAVEQLYLNTLMSTEDAVEGIEAFLEKRPPHWQDK